MHWSLSLSHVLPKLCELLAVVLNSVVHRHQEHLRIDKAEAENNLLNPNETTPNMTVHPESA